MFTTCALLGAKPKPVTAAADATNAFSLSVGQNDFVFFFLFSLDPTVELPVKKFLVAFFTEKTVFFFFHSRACPLGVKTQREKNRESFLQLFPSFSVT